MMTWNEPTGGGPNSAIAAWTIVACAAVSDSPPRYRPSAAATSVEVYPMSVRPASAACAHAALLAYVAPCTTFAGTSDAPVDEPTRPAPGTLAAE